LSQAKTSFSYEFRTINGSLDKLEANGYIIQELGSHEEKKMTTMTPTDRLMQWFEDTEWSDEGVDKRGGTYVTLRKAKKDNVFFFPDREKNLKK
jgi:hypothetical protein